MARTYGRFAAAPIGPQYTVRNGGLIVTATAPVVGGLARSDIELTAGSHGAEFVFWGDDPMFGVVGVTRPDAPIDQGPAFAGIGYRLHSGEIGSYAGNLATGLPLSAKGDIIGVHVAIGTPHVVTFYRNGVQIWQGNIAIAGPLVFAVALAANQANGLFCAVNAGQWTANSPAAVAAWANDPVSPIALKLADYDHLSQATDVPAHARYEGVLVDGFQTEAGLDFWPWDGNSPMQAGTASCTVLDGTLLDSVALQDVRGTPVVVRQADASGRVADATPVARYVLDRIEVQGAGRKQLVMRDAHDDLDLPLSNGVFLPNIPALAFKPLPVVIGAVASVPGLVANSDGSVLFLANRALASVASVMDRGDVMEAGTYEVTPDGQQLLMYSPPVGPVVADVSSIGAGQQPATLRQFLTALFATRGKSAWSAADADFIQAQTGYAGIGYYSGEQGVTIRQALAAVLPSYGAWWWQDADGTLRFSRIIRPENYASTQTGELAFDLEERADMHGELEVRPDYAPNLSRRMAYQINAQQLSAADLVTDLVDVPQARRDQLTAPFRGQVYAGAPLPGCYAHADTAEPMYSCFWREQDAQTECNRVIGLYSVPRSFYLWELRDSDLTPQPGQIGSIRSSRYQLSAGKPVLVRRVSMNRATGAIRILAWG